MESSHISITSKRFGILLLGIIVVFVSLCSYRISQFMTADENYWLYERIPAYYQAWGNWKLPNTMINDKPGVTLALVAAPAIAIYPDPYAIMVKDKGFGGGGGERFDVVIFENALLAFRLPIVLFTALCLGLIALALRVLAGPAFSLLATLGIATLPFIVGMSRIMNPDSLLWSTGTVTLLALLAWGQTHARSWLLVGIVATSLALLSKYTAVFVVVLALGALVVQTLALGTPWKGLARTITAWLTGTVLLCAALLPALIVRPQKLLDTFGQFEFHKHLGILGVGVVLTLIGTLLWRRYGTTPLAAQILLWTTRLSTTTLAIGIITAYTLRIAYPQWPMWALPLDLKDISDAVRYGLHLAPWQSLVWNASALLYTLPLVWLIPILLSPIALWRKNTTKNIQLLALVSSTGILGYFAMLTLMGVAASPRYIVFLYPLSVILAGTVYAVLWGLVPKQKFIAYSIPTILLVLILWPAISSLPYTYSYQNALTPAGTSTSSHWGLGGYEAASYLNTLPNAKSLQIWSDYDGVCEFAVGHCVTNYTYDQNTFNPDYYVLSKRGEERYMGRSKRFERRSGLRAYLYYHRTPTYQYCLADNMSNCVSIYRVDAADRLVKKDEVQP